MLKAVENDTAETAAARTAYGALVLGKTVCSGYARAFKAVCDRMGIECWVLDGIKDKELHEWNAVRIDGEVLYVDATFADGGNAGKYTLISEDAMNKLGYAADGGCIRPW